MTEDADIWEQLQALFHLAEATPENERERVLSENCSDPELLRRVTAIFHGAHIEVEVEPIQPWSGSVLSNKIGPYSILRHLGTGGLGSVYLVMEFVNGVHLDTYCDEKVLAISERLELFLQVCDAVAYAHRNLVVHLDLKPSNILVTPDGMVKLLALGPAKLIQLDSLLTTTISATPAY